MLSLLCLVLVASAVPIPEFIVLNAPYTPYNEDQSVNYGAVPSLAQDALDSGVNTVWVVGGMGQFDVLTLDERNSLLEAWVGPAQKLGLYLIAHVGTTIQQNAIEMASYAASIGADAIASVPPYYEKPGSISALIDWFQPILAAAPDLDFYYYHIPGSTGVSFSMHDFFTQAKASGQLPNLRGVKYVDNNQGDFFSCVTDPNLSEYIFMWAPEPKLQSFGFPGQGTILAESFYAGTFLRMWDEFTVGDHAAARSEQAWKYNIDGIFSAHGGGNCKRAIYRTLCNVTMGVDRQPATQQPCTDYDQMVAELSEAGFFDQKIPEYIPPKN